MNNTSFGSAALYYRHSGRFSPAGVTMALVLGGPIAMLMGTAYAYIDLYNPIAGWVTFLVTGGTGFALGLILVRFIKSGKIRNVPLAMLIAAFLAGLMYLTCWDVWLYALIHRNNPNAQTSLIDVVTQPIAAWNTIVLINSKGNGLLLDIFWLAEAAALLGIPLWAAWAAVHEAPFCEQCNKWCPSRDILKFNPGDRAAIRARLEAKDFSALAALGKAPDVSLRYWRAYFQGCADCDTTQTLCLDELVKTLDKNGKLQTKTTPILTRLVLTPEDIVAVATIAAMLSTPPAPEPTPETPEEPAPDTPAADASTSAPPSDPAGPTP